MADRTAEQQAAYNAIKTGNTGAALAASTTINRYGAANLSQAASQQAMNQQYGLANTTGLNGTVGPANLSSGNMTPAQYQQQYPQGNQTNSGTVNPGSVYVDSTNKGSVGPGATQQTGGIGSQGSAQQINQSGTSSVQSQSVPAPGNVNNPMTSTSQNPNNPAQQNNLYNPNTGTPQGSQISAPQASFAGGTQPVVANSKSMTVSQPNQITGSDKTGYDINGRTFIRQADALAYQQSLTGNAQNQTQTPVTIPSATGLPPGITDYQQWANVDPTGFNAWKNSKAWALPTSNSYSSDNTSSSMIDSIKKQSGIDLMTQLTMAKSDPSTTGASILKQALMAQLLTIDDPAVANYLDRMDQRATAAYQTGLDRANVSDMEINAAIDGTLTAPSTEAGLIAKVTQQNKDFQSQSIQNDKTFLDARYQAQMTQMQNNRADLEGYTKAKLYSMGAEDSSAGITLISKTLQAADLQIQLAQADYNHGVTSLDIQGRQVMADYTNKITEQVIGIKTDRQNALVNYQQTLDQIDGQKITNEKEQNQQKIQAFGDYAGKVATLDMQQKSYELQQLQVYHQMAQDVSDNAIKMSGMTGTVWVPGADGKPVNTGYATFDSTKWTQGYDLQKQQYQLSKDSNRQTLAFNLLNTYGSKAAPNVEQLLGMKSGSLSGMTQQDITNYLGYYKDMLSYQQMMGGTNAILPKELQSNTGGMPSFQDLFGTSAVNPANPTASTSFVNTPTRGTYDVTPQANGTVQVNAQDGTIGGECGHFVNDYMGQRLMGNSYDSKAQYIDPKLGFGQGQTPPPAGSVFVMKVPGSSYGHTGVYLGGGIQADGTVQVKDSNWSKTDDQTIRTHGIAAKSINGYFVPPSSQTSTPQQSTPTNWVGSYLASMFTQANASDASKFAGSVNDIQPQKQQYTFSDEQNAMFQRYTLGDTRDYEALATNEYTKRAWDTSWHAWMTQHPEFDNASRKVDPNTVAQAQSVQKLLDDSDTAKNFFKVDNAYQGLTDPNATDFSYVSFLKSMSGQDNASIVSGNFVDTMANKIMNGSALTDNERTQIKQYADYIYSTAYRNYNDYANWADSQSESMVPQYPGGYKVHRRALAKPLSSVNYNQAGQQAASNQPMQTSSGILTQPLNFWNS